MKKKLLLAIAILTISIPLSAQSIEERLSRLEQEVVALKAENAELRKQVGLAAAATAQKETPAPKAEAVVVRAAGKETEIVFGGMLQAQGETGDRPDARWADDNDRIYLRRMRLSTQGRFAEHFDFRVETDFTGTLGNSSGLRAQLTDAYVTWNEHKAAQVRVGQMKTPFGYDQLTSDVKLIAPERTLGNDRITLGRQLGVQLLGDVANKRVNYAIGAFGGNGTNLSYNDDEGFLVAGRVGATLWNGELAGGHAAWSAAANAFTSDDKNVSVAPELKFAGNTFAGTRRGYGIDTQLTAGRLELLAEALRGRYTPEAGGTRELDAWSVLGGWMLTKNLQGVARYDTFDAEGSETNTWTAGTNYFIKGNDLKLQLYYLRSDEGEGRVIARIQAVF